MTVAKVLAFELQVVQEVLQMNSPFNENSPLLLARITRRRCQNTGY